MMNESEADGANWQSAISRPASFLTGKIATDLHGFTQIRTVKF